MLIINNIQKNTSKYFSSLQSILQARNTQILQQRIILLCFVKLFQKQYQLFQYKSLRNINFIQMNDSDSEHSQDSYDGSKHIESLHAAWKNIRDIKKRDHSRQLQKQSQKKSIGSVKQAIHLQQQKNLQTRLAMTEKQLNKARENTALLMKKLSQAQQQIQHLAFELQKQRKEKQNLFSQVDELRFVVNQRQKQGTFGNQRQINISLKQEIDVLKKKNQLKDRDIDRLTLKIKSLELDRKNLENQAKTLLELNQTYKRQLSDTENAMNQIYLGQQSKGAQLLQLDEAQKTIARLVQILRVTEQYHQFGNFAHDAQQLHFLKNIPKRIKNNQLNHQLSQKRKACSCMDIKIDEKILWTPAACYKTMLDLKMKYSSLTQDCIEELLFELNKIWLARQEDRVKRVRQVYQHQLGRLKKKSMVKYDEFVARKQIQRLKKQLTGSKYSKKTSSGAIVDMGNLKALGQKQDQLRLRQRQIKLLHERIKLIETEVNSNDKVLYMQGALWIIDKVIMDLETNEEDLRQFQLRFRDKIEQNLSQQDWIRSYKQFFQNINEIQNVLLQKLFLMKQSLLKKMGNQRTTMKQPSLVDNKKY